MVHSATSARAKPAARKILEPEKFVVAFPSALGWMAAVFHGGALARLAFGYQSRREALAALEHAAVIDAEHAYGGVQLALAAASTRVGDLVRALAALDPFARNHGPSPESAYRRALALQRGQRAHSKLGPRLAGYSLAHGRKRVDGRRRHRAHFRQRRTGALAKQPDTRPLRASARHTARLQHAERRFLALQLEEEREEGVTVLHDGANFFRPLGIRPVDEKVNGYKPREFRPVLLISLN